MDGWIMDGVNGVESILAKAFDSSALLTSGLYTPTEDDSISTRRLTFGYLVHSLRERARSGIAFDGGRCAVTENILFTKPATRSDESCRVSHRVTVRA